MTRKEGENAPPIRCVGRIEPVRVHLHAAPGRKTLAELGQRASRDVKRELSQVPKDVKLDKPMPVILFMHGCSGIQAAETGWAPFLRQNGFVVVLPDSFARERPQSCDPRTGRGGLFPRRVSIPC